jgi:hypothetical protein
MRNGQRLLGASKRFHSISVEELDALQKIFDQACVEQPNLCGSDIDRLKLARQIVISNHKGLSEIAVATLAMSLII